LFKNNVYKAVQDGTNLPSIQNNTWTWKSGWSLV